MTGTFTFAYVADVAWGVLLAVVPLLLLFLVFQVMFLQLPAREVGRILTGTLVASLGLFLFLLGVSVGFVPFGRAMGETMGAWPVYWLVPFGMLVGFVTTWGEPAVRILANQVEEASAGSIHGTWVVQAVCAGVAVATGTGLYRIAYGVPLLWLVVPGYLIVLAIIVVSDRTFVAVAADSGGVATGPLANTFLLALAFGAAAAFGGRDPLVDGLGLVSLIALAPIISVMALGLLVRMKSGKES